MVLHTWLGGCELGVKFEGPAGGHLSRPLFWRERRSLLLPCHQQTLPGQLA